MNEWRQAKADYDMTEIPDELTARVQLGIKQAERATRKQSSRKLMQIAIKAAACFIVIFAVLNISPMVAAAAGDLPVLGGLFRVLTIRSWHEKTGDTSYDVDVPAIENGNNYTDRVSKEIQARVDEKIAEGEQIIQDYKNAFFETGGTKAQWDEHDNHVLVTYSIRYETDSIVSFVVITNISIADAYQDEFFYNLDLVKNSEITLEDLLGIDWVKICNESIRRQIEEYSLLPGETGPFFSPEMGGFSTVDKDTQFYINAEGNPVIVFPRASIAIGAMGSVEFAII